MHRPRLFDEEVRRRGQGNAQTRGGQWFNRKYVFARQPEDSPARGEDPELRDVGKQVGEKGKIGCHLLHVVEHQQHWARAQRESDCLTHRIRRGLADANGAGSGRQYVAGVARVGERHEVHLVVERIAGRVGDLNRQPCLADSARTEQRHQPNLWPAQQCRNPVQIVRSPDEGRGGEWQRRITERRQRHGCLDAVE